jgi:hypothetical protein
MRSSAIQVTKLICGYEIAGSQKKEEIFLTLYWEKA